MAIRSGGAARIPSLDGLRALALGMVLCGHSVPLHAPQILGWIGNYAEFGVRIFFVLSGFLITTLLLEELEVTGRISLKNFYLRRAFRIFPASYTYILVISLLAASGVIALHAHDLVYALTYTANYDPNRSWYIGQLWSLGVEEQFYLLWPLALFLLGRKRGAAVAGAVILVVPIIRVGEFILFPALRPDFGGRFEQIADSLAAGCLLALVREWLGARQEYIRLLSSKLFVLVPIAILILALPGYRLRWQYTAGYTLMNLGIALCLDWSMRHYDSRMGKFLNWRPMVFIGVLSYSMYLWQQPFLDRYVHSPLTMFPLNLGLAFAAGLASYYLVERRFLSLRKRFGSHGVRVVAAPSATPENALAGLATP